MTSLENEPVEGTSEYSYNKKQKTIRSPFERCNGVLKMKFRYLLKHRVLHYAPKTANKIINACVVLHDLGIEHVRVRDDDDDIAQADLGIYDLLINNGDNEGNIQRINPELAPGRRLRSTIVHNLQV
ncbi:hypothetical protein JTB14_031609 [Gonioctena quinquepunctata]|nr:hypothetical protein JTB14_031609 [Gonioctena quinquepunctata]